MSETQWDKRLFDFLKRTSDEIKSETQRIVAEIQDPAKYKQVRENLREFGNWAKQTAEEAAEMVEAAIKKAETAFSQQVRPGAPPSPNGKKAEEKAQSSPPSRPSGGSSSPHTARKSVGKGKSAGSKKGRTGGSSKTIGRKS